jgi:hypothetical protein
MKYLAEGSAQNNETLLEVPGTRTRRRTAEKAKHNGFIETWSLSALIHSEAADASPAPGQPATCEAGRSRKSSQQPSVTGGDAIDQNPLT